ADAHAVAHEVARLVVAHAVPGLGADAREVVDGECVGLRLHHPVALARAHAMSSAMWVASSQQTASSRTSQASRGSASTRCTEKPAPTSHGGAGRACRNARLRSYQPPPMPSRWQFASK